ncbi:MAG: hypothetical protein H8E60_09565 [Candidatus Marinimicrobia bacterium]|nr:hypothetical protein [Candidatus Neomarinimicrobiota bacterium]
MKQLNHDRLNLKYYSYIRFASIVGISLLSIIYSTELKLNKKPPVVVFDGTNGGRIDSTSWSSKEISGTTFTLVYLDPDKRGLNEDAVERLRQENFPKEKLKSIIIVNMAASWVPIPILKLFYGLTIKIHPLSLFVFDMDKILMKEWGLVDEEYNFLVLSKTGELKYISSGMMSEEEVDKLITVLWNEINL